MHKIVYSPQAIIDLDESIAHIYDNSSANARAYRVRYERKIELLRHNPEMGTECHNKHIDLNCRVLVFESHLIVYETDVDEILIIRIFHQSKNYQQEF